MKELIGEVEEAVPATKKAKRSAKGDDNMSDLLGSDAEEGGSDVDSDAEIEDDDEEEEEEDEDESEQEEGNGNGSDDDASSKEDARFNKKGTRVGVKKQLIAQGKKPSKHSSRGGAKGKVVKAKSNGKAAGAKGKRRA